MKNRKPMSLVALLGCLTCLYVAAQIVFFFIHYQLHALLDVISKSTIFSGHFSANIWLPIALFIALQIIAYVLLVIFVWFLGGAIARPFSQAIKIAYIVGILLWLLCATLILLLNSKYYPHSFFAPLFAPYTFLIKPLSIIFLILILIAYFNAFIWKHHRLLACLFFGMAALACAFDLVNNSHDVFRNKSSLPNIIIIGLDSLRPDFINQTQTPNIYNFTQHALNFNNAYTPLARTFPSWISILTAEYPKHNHARINLAASAAITRENNLAKHLQTLGYETIYATDEKRFSNITKEYGFDKLVGPPMGVNDFLLGSLTDFPLTNLLLKIPLSRILFPYHYANRAAAITYDPQHFLQLINRALYATQKKPLFLAVHLCVSHWPYFKADDSLTPNASYDEQYRLATHSVDTQLRGLFALFKQHRLLEHSLVVLLSDHGTTLGLANDRLISEENFMGNKSDLLKVPHYKRSDNGRLTLDTSYGQATDILSLKQYRVLLAFRTFGFDTLPERQMNMQASLLDVAPTILDIVHLPIISKQIDGTSLIPYINASNMMSRPLYLETADTIAEIETNEISLEKVLRQRIHAYQINPMNTLLSINPEQDVVILKNKQRAVLWEDWLLALYPAKKQETFVMKDDRFVVKIIHVPAFFVLANKRTGLWTTDLSSPWAKLAPLSQLLAQLQAFYGDEVVLN